MRLHYAVLAAALLATPALAQSQPALPTCEAPEHRALDFWVGEWEAFRADNGALSGRSSIRAEDRGCAVTEHWTSANAPFTGQSINLYDRVSGNWEQYWVSSTGNRIYFVGGPIENGVRMTTPEARPQNPGGPAVFSRVTLTSQPDGTVQQRGETSENGENWTVNYVLVYRRRAE